MESKDDTKFCKHTHKNRIFDFFPAKSSLKTENDTVNNEVPSGIHLSVFLTGAFDSISFIVHAAGSLFH